MKLKFRPEKTPVGTEAAVTLSRSKLNACAAQQPQAKRIHIRSRCRSPNNQILKTWWPSDPDLAAASVASGP